MTLKELQSGKRKKLAQILFVRQAQSLKKKAGILSCI